MFIQKAGLLLAATVTTFAMAATAGCTERASEDIGDSSSSVTSDSAGSDRVTLVRSFRPGHGHTLSVRSAPAGHAPELSIVISIRGQRALFACEIAGHNFPSTDPNCEGHNLTGFLGYADNGPGRQPFYRCVVTGSLDHFVSADEKCEGQTSEGVIGWAESIAGFGPPPPPAATPVALVLSAGAKHWVSRGAPQPGFIEEQRFLIKSSGDRPLYACFIRHHAMASLDPNCEGQEMLGLLGYIDAASDGSSSLLYRCSVNLGDDHFISLDPNCGGWRIDGPLGWVKPTASPPPPPPVPVSDNSSSGG